MTPTRTEFGFTRTECACEQCIACCEILPAYLVPSDIEVIVYSDNKVSNSTIKFQTVSLRRAAIKLMKNRETNHPFYWAGFVLVGDGR